MYFLLRGSVAVWGSSVSGSGRPGLAPGLGLGLMCLILLGTAAMCHIVLIANCQKGRREGNSLRPLRLQPSHFCPLSIGQGCHMAMPNLKGWEKYTPPNSSRRYGKGRCHRARMCDSNTGRA